MVSAILPPSGDSTLHVQQQQQEEACSIKRVNFAFSSLF
jgi:hypothetical protein